MAIKIKIFEHLHVDDPPDHINQIADEINNFLLSIPENRVITVVFDCHPLGNHKRTGTARCVGYVVYKT